MRLVVAGGVAAGMSAASQARARDRGLEIVVLEAGPVVSYGACGMPYFLEGRISSPEGLLAHTPAFFERERNIRIRLHSPVTAIRPSNREVEIAGGERIPFDYLVIATGASPHRLGASDKPGILTFYTYQDAQLLKGYLDEHKPRTAAVVGGGYLGLETAEALTLNGLSVTLYHSGNDLMGRDDPAMTAALLAQLQSAGVTVVLNHRVSDVQALRKSFDLVVLCAGASPNAQLAGEAGIRLGVSGAIAVNPRQETNVSGIYAAGDCAETIHRITGRSVYLPHGTTANKTGRIAGANVAGAREEFPGVVGTRILGLFGLGCAVTGFSPVQAKREGYDVESVEITAPDKAKYFGGKPTTIQLVAERRTGQLLGGSVTGYEGVAGRINVIAACLFQRLTVEEAQYLDLAYAPPFATATDPLLVAAHELRKRLAGLRQ